MNCFKLAGDCEKRDWSGLLNLLSRWVTLTGPPWSDRVVIPSYEPHKTNWGERIKPRTDFDAPSFSSPSKLNNYILLTMMILIGILIWNLGAVKTWDRVEIATSRLIVKILPQMPAIFKCIGFHGFQIVHLLIRKKNYPLNKETE